MVPQPIGRRKTLLGFAGAALGAIGLSGAVSDAKTQAEELVGASLPNQGPVSESKEDAASDDQNHIQEAVDAASEGDTVRIQRGTYPGSVTIDTADLTLRSVESHGATIDARGRGTGVRIQADGVTVEGFEIDGDGETASGVSIVTSNGGTRDITVRDNHIHGMAKPGGGGIFAVNSWGILSWGDAPLSGVKINRNTIENIGGPGEDDDTGFSLPIGLDMEPIGVGIDLKQVKGERRREGAIVWGNTIKDIADGSVRGTVAGMTVNDDGVRLPGVGIAIQPLDGELGDTGDTATDVHRNVVEGTSVDVIMGDIGLSRVFNNNR